jgi:hypothetical protein
MKSHSQNGSQPPESKRELASRYFREFYTSCFWHYRQDLPITEDRIPLVEKELRRHGGRRGLVAAARIASAPCR